MAVGRYPALLDIDGRACLVVGGGAVAERKVAGLLRAGARVTVLAPGEGLAAGLAERADDGVLRWRDARLGPDESLPEPDGPGPWALVMAATDDPAVNAAVVAQATALGIWANDASAADGGPLAVPAVHRDGPLLVAVGTGGTSPMAAGWIRDRLAAVLGPEVGAALTLAWEVGQEVEGGGRVDWRAAVDSGMLDLVRHGQTAEAKERLKACLSSSSE